MCGIIGIVGTQPVQQRLIESLKRLEYRGYDSAGIAGVVQGRVELVDEPEAQGVEPVGPVEGDDRDVRARAVEENEVVGGHEAPSGVSAGPCRRRRAGPAR